MTLPFLTRFGFPATLRGKHIAVLAIVLLLGLSAPSGEANARWCCCCGCCGPSDTGRIIRDAFTDLRNNFILGSLYTGVGEGNFRSIASEVTTALLLQARMIGGFYDAQAHHAAQLELQKLAAIAVRDYTPSESVCQFGTLVRSLPASDLKARTNQLALSEIDLARNMGTYNNIASSGRGEDNANRIALFIKTFCSSVDSGDGLSLFCNISAATSDRFNRDIDYARTFAVPETLNVDFTNNTGPSSLTRDENNIIMLGHNLYGHTQILKRMDKGTLESAGAEAIYPLIRSIGAKRSVAQNSFNAIAGMKAAGTGASASYVRQILTNLGMTAADISRYTSSANPSYLAQMEILTRRIYQDPAFYAHLMDKPANVARQTAAMESLEMMQDRDIFTSMARSETLLSVLVEMEAIKVQSKIQNDMTTR